MGDDVVRDEASVWAIGFFFAGDLVRADLSDVVFYPFFTVNSMKRMLSTQAASIILAGCEQYVLQRWHDVTGNILLLLREAMAFVKANTRKGWEKLPDGRKNKPEYAERAVLEALVNHFIHRDYTVMGSEVHLDIFDDRLAITSPGGMYSGQNSARIIFEIPIWMRKDDVKRYVKVSYRKDTFYHFLVYLCDVFTSIIIEIYINDDKSV